MLAPRPSATRVAFEEATTLRFGFRRGALAFWLASLVGIAGAIALGVPAALLFAGVMRRVGRQGAWRAAVVTGGVLSAALAFAFEALAALVMSDWGYARAPGVLVAAAAAAMMAGAVGGTLAGRRRRWAVR